MELRAQTDRAARVRFGVTAVLLVAARALDAVSTYLATPDLKQEANPLQRAFHLGWPGLLLVNALVLALMIYAAWRAAFVPPALPNDAGLDLQSFVARFWFSRNERRSLASAIFWLPADRRVRWAFIGGPGAALVILASLLVAGGNLLIAYHVHIPLALARVWVSGFWAIVLVGLYIAVRAFLLRAYARYTRQRSEA